MARPRLLLVPGLTELEWVIKPQLEEWAEVASFDPPGVGSEPRDGRAVGRSESVTARSIQALDELGWETCVVAADGWGVGAAALLAERRPEAVAGLALGHAALSHEMDGERPAVNREIWEAMRQLLRQDWDSFVRYGIAQMTRGSYDEELAQQMLERFDMENSVDAWERIGSEQLDWGEILAGVDAPTLLARHEGCILYTDDGFDDAVAALPEARAIVTTVAPCADPAFAAALRELCSALEF